MPRAVQRGIQHVLKARYNNGMTAAKERTPEVFPLAAFPCCLPETRVWGSGAEKHAFIGPRCPVNLTSQLGFRHRCDGTVSGLTIFRDQAATGIQEAIFRKEARLKALWNARLANQMAVLPPFDQVFREFRRALRLSDLP